MVRCPVSFAPDRFNPLQFACHRQQRLSSRIATFEDQTKELEGTRAPPSLSDLRSPYRSCSRWRSHTLLVGAVPTHTHTWGAGTCHACTRARVCECACVSRPLPPLGAAPPPQPPCPSNGPHTHGPCRPPAGAWKTATRRNSGRWHARQPSPPGAEEAGPRASPRCGLALSASRPAHRPTTAAAWTESHCACAPGTARSPATTPRRPPRAGVRPESEPRVRAASPSSHASFNKPKELCAQLSHKELQLFFVLPPPPEAKRC